MGNTSYIIVFQFMKKNGMIDCVKCFKEIDKNAIELTKTQVFILKQSFCPHFYRMESL